MAVRTNYADVNSIMDGMTVTEADVNKYIAAANTMVNTVLGTTASDLYTEIEKWLAGHMLAITRERVAKIAEAGTAKIEYIGKWGAGLQSTSYGQMVLALDTSGTFMNLEKKPAFLRAVQSFDA